MNKNILCVLVNCNRVLEGTLRNVLPAMLYTVQVMRREDFEHGSFDDPEPKTSPAVILTNDNQPVQDASATGLDAAREAVAAMLAKNVNGGMSSQMESVPEPSPASLTSPDCIIYQVSDNHEQDVQTVRLLRRKCRFRDIPILIATPFSELPKANILIQQGANAVLVYPAKPEALVKAIGQSLEPAGMRMPVITKVVNPYVSATVDLLSTMAGMHAEKKDVFLKKNYRLFGDISAIMPLSGKVEGEVVVCFEEKLAREVVASIMTTQPEMLTKDELKEGIGEVVNIISGNAKAALAQSEYMHHIGLPTVIFGQGHELAHPGNAPCIVVIFEVNKQPLAVLVSMAVKTF